MLYIDLINNKEELLKEKEKKYNLFLKKIIIFLRKRTNYIAINKTEFGELLKLQNFNNVTCEKLKKILKVNSVKTICLSQKVNNNEKINEIFINENIRIIKGNELKKYLLLETIEYICNNKLENLHEQEVSFLVKKNNFLVNCIIRELAKKVKILNIITNNSRQFKILEKNLFEKDGIILNIIDNHKKSLIKSNFIINIDYLNEEINKYTMPKYCCLINLSNETITINKKSFEGININDIKYFVNDRYIKNRLPNFDKEILYESIIIRNSNPENILNKIKKDKLKVIEVYGKNGKISRKEFEKLKRKIIS